MNRKIKLAVSLVAVLLALGLLFYQGFNAGGGMGEYLTIEEAMADYKRDEEKFIQMEGMVINSSIRYDIAKPLLVFDLTDDKNNVINIKYNDIKPDNFEDGNPVIVEGRFTGDNKFVAEKLKVKCPSKYEEEPEQKN